MFAICGCSGCVSQRLNDASEAVDQNGNQEYNLNGVRWEVDPVVHQAGATVTWSMATANYAADYIQFDGFITDAQFISVIRAAFDAWEQVTNIDFVEVSDSSNVDIRLGFGDIDGSSGTLGIAYYSWNGSNELTQSFIEFDSGENWNLNIGSTGPGNQRLCGCAARNRPCHRHRAFRRQRRGHGRLSQRRPDGSDPRRYRCGTGDLRFAGLRVVAAAERPAMPIRMGSDCRRIQSTKTLRPARSSAL